eukprot:366465-Chlamydomonas_euryale.AAC.18
MSCPAHGSLPCATGATLYVTRAGRERKDSRARGVVGPGEERHDAPHRGHAAVDASLAGRKGQTVALHRGVSAEPLPTGVPPLFWIGKSTLLMPDAIIREPTSAVSALL